MTTTADPMPRRAQENLLLFSVFFVAAPHIFHLDFQIVLFFALMVLWRCAAGYRPFLLPNRPLLLLLTVAGAVLVYYFHHRFYGRDAGASLFLVGLGLKLMEMRTRREVYLVIYLAFFVALTQYLFSQSIPMAVYTLMAVGLAVAVLIGLNAGPSLTPKVQAKWSAGLVMQALPIMVVLFLFFPRIPGPLWRLPDEERGARTGLSDTIEPGSISSLSLSEESAFRVDFEGPLPPPAERYWRGPVFWHTDGRRWTLQPDQPLTGDRKPAFSGPAYRYTVTLEPHRKHWVFGLDLPAVFPAEVSQTAEFLLLSKTKIAERRQFRLISHPRFRTGGIRPSELRWGLQLPKPPSSRVQRLVERWSASSRAPRDWVDRSLRYFREEPFVYTLNPPSTGDDSVDAFLFETRRGFCEHYATAFVYLMRAAGIPARVVTGYQGGQWNPVGKFLEVRQADAHAWAEVWLAGDGWTRIDPTAAVAPERIEYGIDLERQVRAREVSFNPLEHGIVDTALNVQGLYRQARMVWATIDHLWNQRVLSYNPDHQRRFWNALGIVDWRGLSLWIGGLLGLSGILIALFLLPRRQTKTDPAVAVYRRFLRKLARRGVIKKTGEGPLDFARRAIAEKPGTGDEIGRITEVYLRIRYGRQADRRDLDRLRRLVKALRI
jgi:transglutaminase-like putative cysteine protease